MFDIGFPELMLVAVVALLVLGPERLPGALRALGLWIGRARRSFARVQAELEREIGADEIRRQLHNESILAQTRALREQAEALGRDVRESTRIQPPGIRTPGEQDGPRRSDGPGDQSDQSGRDGQDGQDGQDDRSETDRWSRGTSRPNEATVAPPRSAPGATVDDSVRPVPDSGPGAVDPPAAGHATDDDAPAARRTAHDTR